MVDTNGRLVDDPKFVGPWGFACFIIHGIHTVYMCLDLPTTKITQHVYLSIYTYIIPTYTRYSQYNIIYHDGISHTAFPQSNVALGNPHICHEQTPSVKISHRY